MHSVCGSCPPKKQVTVDFLPTSAFRYVDYDAIVCIDVLRATTTLVTASTRDRRAFVAYSLSHALRLCDELPSPLLAGDLAGQESAFEIQNSPKQLDSRQDTERPLVLVSSTGTKLLANASGCPAVYVTCLRNLTATAEHVAKGHRRVAILAACKRLQLRCEDLMASARLAAMLVDHGFELQSPQTEEVVERWSTADYSLAHLGRSAEYLRETHQYGDVDFALNHIDDVDAVCKMSDNGEVTRFEPAGVPIVAAATGSFAQDAMGAA